MHRAAEVERRLLVVRCTGPGCRTRRRWPPGTGRRTARPGWPTGCRTRAPTRAGWRRPGPAPPGAGLRRSTLFGSNSRRSIRPNVVLAVPCSPFGWSTGYGPAGRTAAHSQAATSSQSSSDFTLRNRAEVGQPAAPRRLGQREHRRRRGGTGPAGRSDHLPPAGPDRPRPPAGRRTGRARARRPGAGRCGGGRPRGPAVDGDRLQGVDGGGHPLAAGRLRHRVVVQLAEDCRNCAPRTA